MTTPEPTITGELSQTPFLHLVVNLHLRTLTGTLAIWPETETRGQDRIYFQEGVPVGARLLQTSTAVLDRAILPLFDRQRGAFAFYQDHDLVGEQALRGRVDPLTLMTASLRHRVREEAIHAVLAPYSTTLLRLRPGLELKRYGFVPKEERVIEVARAGPSTIDELAAATELGPEMGRRLVYLLLITRALEPYDPPARSSSPGQASGAPAPRTSTPAQAPVRNSPPPAAPYAAPAAASTASPPQSDTPPPGLSAQALAFFVETKQRFAKLDSQNYFEMLGVARDAGAESVRKQYIQLAKRWHPDRLPPELAVLRPEAEQIFQWMTSAHDTLVDEQKRVAHLRQVQDGGGTPEADRQLAAIVGAAMEQQKAEVLIRRRDFGGARMLLERALSLNDEDADLHATYALALSNLGQGDALLPSVLHHTERALQLAKDHDRAHVCRALALRRLGREAEAIQHFKLASEANPKNLDALREVRVARMRGQLDEAPTSVRPPPKSEEGLLSKLFGSPKKKK